MSKNEKKLRKRISAAPIMTAKCCGTHAKKMSDFLLKYGSAYEPRERPNKYKQDEPARCFANSVILAEKQGLIYVEGVAFYRSWDKPVHHGWCVTPKTHKVVDVTWDGALGYFGIALSRQVMQDHESVTDHLPVLKEQGYDWCIFDYELIKLDGTYHTCVEEV